MKPAMGLRVSGVAWEWLRGAGGRCPPPPPAPPPPTPSPPSRPGPRRAAETIEGWPRRSRKKSVRLSLAGRAGPDGSGRTGRPGAQQQVL